MNHFFLLIAHHGYLFIFGVVFSEAIGLPEADNDWRFVKFRPPITATGAPAPHIRLDRALQFLIGDRLA